jgi:hypothetical protein
MGGYYLGNDTDGWTFNPDLVVDIPSRFYAHRVSEYEGWLDANVVIPEPQAAALIIALGALVMGIGKRRRHSLV